MATYQELFSIRNDPVLHEKVTVAVTIKAQSLIDSTSPTQADIDWAKETLDNPSERADRIMYYVLAANSTATVAQIQGASDSLVQANVDSAVLALIAGGT